MPIARVYPRHHLGGRRPGHPCFAALLHVPLAGGVQAEVPSLPMRLTLEEELGLLHASAKPPVGRPLAVRRDPELDDRALVAHDGRRYGKGLARAMRFQREERGHADLPPTGCTQLDRDCLTAIGQYHRQVVFDAGQHTGRGSRC